MPSRSGRAAPRAVQALAHRGSVEGSGPRGATVPRPSRAGARTGVAVLAAVAASVLAGCASLAGDASGGSTLPPPALPSTAAPGDAGSAVVLRVEDLGGMTSSTTLVTRLPQVSVHADGRVVREIATYAASVDEEPALPRLVQRTVTPAGLDALVERARDAGVGDGTDLSYAPVTDNSTTRFLLVADDGPAWSDAYALNVSARLGVPIGEPAPSPSIPVGRGSVDSTFTQEQADARYRLLDLADALADLPAALGAGEVGEETPYVPEAVAVLAVPRDEQPAPDPIAWPGPALPGESMGDDGVPWCLVVRGGDVAPVLEAAGRALWSSPWTDGGTTWSVRFRPLLPDEHGCADLAPRG